MMTLSVSLSLSPPCRRSRCCCPCLHACLLSTPPPLRPDPDTASTLAARSVSLLLLRDRNFPCRATLFHAQSRRRAWLGHIKWPCKRCLAVQDPRPFAPYQFLRIQVAFPSHFLPSSRQMDPTRPSSFCASAERASSFLVPFLAPRFVWQPKHAKCTHIDPCCALSTKRVACCGLCAPPELPKRLPKRQAGEWGGKNSCVPPPERSLKPNC